MTVMEVALMATTVGTRAVTCRTIPDSGLQGLVAGACVCGVFALAGCAGGVSPDGGSTVNPRILESFQSSFCHGSMCAPADAAGSYGLEMSRRSRDDEHRLLRAAEAVNSAAGAALFSGMSVDERDIVSLKSIAADKEFKLALADALEAARKASQPVIGGYVKTLEKVVFPRAGSERIRTCLRAYATAFRRMYEEDPLYVIQDRCRKADPDSDYETLVATFEIIYLSREEIAEDFIESSRALVASARDLSRDVERHFHRLLGLMRKRANLLDDRLEKLDWPEALVRAPALKPLADAIAEGYGTWKESNVRRACVMDQKGKRDDLDEVTRMLSPRFAAVSAVISQRWQRLMEDRVLARLLPEGHLPRLSQAGIAERLRQISMEVRYGPPSGAHYDPETRGVIMPTGLIAQLCRNMSGREIEATVAQDQHLIQRLTLEARANPLRVRDAFGALTQLQSPAALRFAERRELEFLAAIDFLIAHEIAHGLFDHGTGGEILPERDREMRADAFGFMVVDRTSEVSLFKKIASFGMDNSPSPPRLGLSGQERDRTEKELARTLPGGAAMLRIYRETEFEVGDQAHLPLQQRMEWVEKWVQQPLQGR